MNLQNYPSRIVIELTPECNLSCQVCPRHYIADKKGHIAKKLWVSLIEEIAQFAPGTILIPFWRGESLLHPEFCELMELAHAKKLRVHISTNGVAISEEQFRLLARCEFVTFSIHTASGYDNAKKFLGFVSGGHPVTQVSFVEGERSMKEICGAIIGTPDLEGFDSVRVYAQHSKNGVFGSADVKIAGKRAYCPKLIDTLVIAYDGTVSRCNHIWETEKGMHAGDASIREIWNSGCLQRIRDAYPDPKCEPCGQWTGHTLGESWHNENGKIIHKHYDLEN